MKINITVDIPGLGVMKVPITSPFTAKELVNTYYELYDKDQKKLYTHMNREVQMAFWFILLELYKKEHEEEFKKIRDSHKFYEVPAEFIRR